VLSIAIPARKAPLKGYGFGTIVNSWDKWGLTAADGWAIGGWFWLLWWTLPIRKLGLKCLQKMSGRVLSQQAEPCFRQQEITAQNLAFTCTLKSKL
jgi:hypothetical protein